MSILHVLNEVNVIVTCDWMLMHSRMIYVKSIYSYYHTINLALQLQEFD